ncbi:MAG: DUF4286 family protein [Muribaculaceae bacterium]|nr:DUF4286 family protein [Muribaculaceae bacterium]
MYIYNVTFMVENANEPSFLSWMRTYALNAMVNPESTARNPRLTLVADVPGDPEFARQACSFAFQVEFNSISDAEQWAATYLAPVLGAYTEKFGPEHALSFSTILQAIDL